MRSVTGLGLSLVAILSVSSRSFAEPPPPPPAAVPAAAAPDAPPPAAAPAPPPKRKPWKVWLDREKPLTSEWDPELERIWYGWQNLLIDGLALGVIALSAAEGEDAEEAGIWVGIGLLAVGSPIVHFAHQNVSQGFTSLGIRLASGGVILLGAFIAFNSSDDFSDNGGQDSETTGTVVAVVGMLGLATAVILDAAYFGFEERPRRGQSRAMVTPWLDPQHGRFGLGYASSF